MIIRIFKYAFKNIFRNTFLTFTSLLILTLLMFFIMLLVMLHAMTFHIIENVNSKLTFSLYVDEEYSRTSGEMIDFLGEVKESLPNVQVHYSDKEEVYENAAQRFPGVATILGESDVLPETISISNIGLNQFDTLNAIVESNMFLFAQDEDDGYELSSYNNQYKAVAGVIDYITQFRYYLYAFMAIFLISIMVIVYVIIGNFIFYYRDEIYITRLVGGSKAFIYGPFSLQGMIYTGVAYLISLGLFYLFLQNIQYISREGFDFPIVLTNVEIMMLLGSFPLFLALGAFAGWLSSKKYLR